MGRAPTSGTSTSNSSSGLKKGPWTADEDQKLRNYIQQHGAGNWRLLPEKAGLDRCGKSCRLRWTNYLRPDIKRGRFSFEEEEAIIRLHSILGNKWSAIAARLPGRTDNEIKNYWNTHIRRRLLRMGLDPVTHAPRMDRFLGSHNSQTENLSNLLYALNQQQHQMSNPQLMNIVTTLLSINQQQQNQTLYNEKDNNLAAYTPSFSQQPSQGFTTGGSMDDLSGCFVTQESEYNNIGTCGFGSLSDNNYIKQQLSANSMPFTSYASSPFDSTCYTSNGGMSTDEEIDSVLNFEIPEDFDLSELLY